MLKTSTFYIAAFVLTLSASTSLAQEAGLDEAAGISISIENTGPDRVDVSAAVPGESTESAAELMSLAPDEYLEADIPVGTKISVFRPGAATEEGEQPEPFMTYTVQDTPQEQSVAIPDPRALIPVEVTFVNDTGAVANLSLHDVGADKGLKDIGNFDPGAQKTFPVFPGAVLIGRALDGSVLATFQASLDTTHTFSLHASTVYEGQTVPITVENMSGVPVSVKQVFPQSIVRIAAIAPWHRTTVDAAVGSDLKVETNSAHVRVLMNHRVTDALDQDILISHDLALLSDNNNFDSVPLERLPADIREGSVEFLAQAESIKRSNPDAVVFVMANVGDTKTAYALMEGGSFSNHRTIEPGKTMRGLMSVGARMILWPGDIPVNKLALSDIQKVVDLSRNTPEIADFSLAPRATTTVHNDACRPLDLFKVDAFDNPVRVGHLAPAGGMVTVEGYEGAELFARLTDESRQGGTTYWRGLMRAGGSDVLRVRTADDFTHDNIALPRIPEGAADTPRTLLVTNFTSRPISVFQVDATGAIKQMFDASKSPLILEPGTDKTFYTTEGAAMVFRRPNAPVYRSEYGRYRVTAEPNQAVEIGELKTRPREVTGAWTLQPQNEARSENDFGTFFLNVVATGTSDAIEGSSNILQQGNSISATKFEGCAHGEEGYGVWFPAGGAALQCSTPHIAKDGTSHTSYGRYRMSLVDDKLEFTYGYCGENPNRKTEWYPQPDHFDDMDPATEGLTHGMMETAWAPPSFEWLGRGFNLLYADPLNYASTENARAYSQKPLFNFIYQDAQGRTLDSNAKSIFGVTHGNALAASSDCRQTQTQVRTMADMHDFSSKSVSGSIGVPGIASFSLSKSHSEKNNAATGSDHLYIMERCDLRMDELNVNTRWSDQSGYDMMRQPLEPGFRRAVNNLPTEWGDAKALKTFLETYGTHFSERVIYGGTFFAETKVTKETFQRGFEMSDGLGVEATGTIKKVQLGGSYKSEDTEGRNNGNQHANSEYHKWSVGGNGTGVYDSWVTSVTGKDQLRAPIEMQFREITDLLTPVFFPNDPDIGLKNRLVRTGIQTYYKQFAGKDLTTQDLAQGLHIRDPRQICVEMSILQVKSDTAGGMFSGALRGTFVDRSGEVVSGQSGTIGLGIETSDLRIRPDGYLAYAIPASKQVMLTYKNDAQFNWVNAFCTPATKADYVWNGSLCLEGTFTINDNAEDKWSGNCAFSPKLYSLDDLERNVPKIIKDSFTTQSAEVNYEIRLWVP